MSRNSSLDYLRSLAVVIVLANHCFLWFFVSTGKIVWQGGQALSECQRCHFHRWLFVLSGYLIGTMMIRIFDKEQNHLSACRDF